MKAEFKRYGLERFRLMTGALEVLGGLGILVGLLSGPLFLVSTLGLTMLMILGLLVRIKLKDTFKEMLPALILMLLNFYLFSNKAMQLFRK